MIKASSGEQVTMGSRERESVPAKRGRHPGWIESLAFWRHSGRLRSATGAVVILAASCGGNDLNDDRTGRPNIIWIMADDLGYGDLGSYGQERIKTPNLDAMAEEGMRFTDAYAGFTVCAPSRSVLMTGQHTGHTRVRRNGAKGLLDEDITVAELLRKNGYSTALVGKWGLGMEDSPGAPWRQGFDHFFGYLSQGHAHNFYPEFLMRNAERIPPAKRRCALRPLSGYERRGH